MTLETFVLPPLVGDKAARYLLFTSKAALRGYKRCRRFLQTPQPLRVMSFRKRNIVVSSNSANASDLAPLQTGSVSTAPGTRPSPLDGRLTTSTGTPSLDNLLAGHGGLAVGSLMLIEEAGTTDFAGTLLRYYAAEGVVQGHQVHVVGLGQQWGRDLPGLTGLRGREEKPSRRSDEKMKIAWRYERLGEFGSGVARPRGGSPLKTSAQFIYL